MTAVFVAIRALFAGLGWQSWLIGALAICIMWALFTVRSADRAAGAAGATAKIDRANDAARDKADAAMQQVFDCPAGKWVRGEGCKQ